MSETPPEVERLLRERDEARAARDFARADAIRDSIAALGFEIRDSAAGSTAVPARRYESIDAAKVPSVLDEPAETGFSVHLLYEGFADDLERFLGALGKCCSEHEYETIVVDNASGEQDLLEEICGAYAQARVLHLAAEAGWADARNASLRQSRGEIIVVADLSVEPLGDVLAPAAAALADPSVGIAGPFGLVSDDMREFAESAGPEVDAIEGYLLALRRETIAAGCAFDPKFRWYRHADVDLSFRVRSTGARAVVAPCPVAKHTHRGWTSLDEGERAKRSKRNFYRFLDHWKDRHDLLLSHRD